MEAEIEPTESLRRAVVEQLEELAAFGEATDIEYEEKLPESWRPRLLRS